MAVESAVVKDEYKHTENAPVSQPAERRIVFISHANPEDNPAAAWFATRLTLLGFEVWCDVKNTHGGESDLWLKIQKVIVERAAKFVFILSNASCDFDRKKGIYKEVQTADNLRIDNFILPVRIEPLAKALPILVSTSQYINGENWAKALHEIVLRLGKDGVPRNEAIEFQNISSWWPAITAEQQILRTAQEELVTNLFDILSFPTRIHFIRVLQGEAPIAGLGNLRKVLQSRAAFFAHGEYAISFATPADFDSTNGDLEVQVADSIDTKQFLSDGHLGFGIGPEIARNVVTHLVGRAWDAFMASKRLSSKPTGRARRSIWYVRDGLIAGNKVRVVEPGKRSVSIHLVGSFLHYRKTYRWHAGLYSSVDLRVHSGIVLTPKVVISQAYDVSNGEEPIPADDLRLQKKLGWWNHQWRQKLLAFMAWLSDGKSEIAIPVGSQQLVLAAVPQMLTAERTFAEISDDEVINQAMEALGEHTHSS